MFLFVYLVFAFCVLFEGWGGEMILVRSIDTFTFI